MGAAKLREIRLPVFAPVKIVVHVHDLDRLGAASGQVVGVKNGVPEQPHIAARQAIRGGMEEIEPFRSF
jgi:hypothetical protein